MPNSFPQYRVRLFLSVDLVGSTQLKNTSKSNKEWVKIFQKFYNEFPDTLRKKYEEIPHNKRCDGIRLDDEEKSLSPILWKTIGDEILFCCSLQSLVHLSACMTAFIEALVEYGKILSSDKEVHKRLSTKGNAWVASFPTPNCSISLKDVSNEGTVSETIEERVDTNPSEFDFLGKGIDAGFRISKFSSENNFTISPGLGMLLCNCIGQKNITGFSYDVTFIRQDFLKGVVNNNLYPILVINTCRDDRQKSLFDYERKFLKTPEKQNISDLEKYLKEYLEYYEIESPSLKVLFADPDLPPPPFYEKYKAEWEEENKKTQNKENELYNLDTNENINPPSESEEEKITSIKDKIINPDNSN